MSKSEGGERGGFAGARPVISQACSSGVLESAEKLFGLAERSLLATCLDARAKRFSSSSPAPG